ncbi:MAG TPA: ABC transporter permease [Anaerolineae bacterium]|nr:ABC transporter permease [Anaerolineae bacterium]
MLRQILSLTLKDLKILFKDTGGVATLFLMPMMFIFVMTLALGSTFGDNSDNPIEVLIVNEDSGPVGAQIVEGFKAVAGFSVETDWDGAALTRAQAEELIANQTRNIAVVIPAGFSETIERATFETPAGQSSEVAQIDLITDPALSAQFVGPIRGTLAGLAQQATLSAIIPRGLDLFLDQIGLALGAPLPDSAREALRGAALQATDGGNTQPAVTIQETQPAGMQVEQRPNSVQQNVPGWTLFGVFFIANLLATSVLEEKRVGTFRRILAAPMSRATFLLGKLLPNLIVNLIQIALMFAVGVFVMPLFGTPRLELGAHPEALIVISVAASLAATGLGLLIAALGKTAEQIGGLSSLLVVTMAALGGVMVPRFVMPDFLQTIGLVTPHAWALDAYQSVLVRGYDVLHVLPHIGALLAFAAVFFGIALWRFKWD